MVQNETMKTRQRQIAKVGVFGTPDNPVIVTEKDLKEIEETFVDIKTAPVKLGSHYSEDRPRLGQVVSVKFDSKTKVLDATIEEHDTLADAIDIDGFYPDCSIGAKMRASDGKMYLHHLAYLGDEPPAIKDLEMSLAETLKQAETAMTKNQNSANTQSEVKSGVPDVEYHRFGLTAADEAGALHVLASAGAARLYLSDSPVKENFMTSEEIKALQEENARLKADAEARQKELADRFEAERACDLERLKKACDGKLTAEQTANLLELADSFERGKKLELSDASGKKNARNPVAVLADIFESVSAKVEPGALNLSDAGAVSLTGKKAEPIARAMIKAL